MSCALAIDLYHGDTGFDLAGYLEAAWPWCGVIGKASQGTRYKYTEWLLHLTDLVRGHPRYGDTLGLGFYHYYDFSAGAIPQAESHLRVIEAVGGRACGDFFPIVDIERGGQHQIPSRAQLENVVPKYAEKIHEATGCWPILYGGELLRALETKSHLSCSYLWTACYGLDLPKELYTQIGWTPEELFAWQGVGVEGGGKVDGKWHLPKTTPVGDADISTFTLGDLPGEKAWELIKKTMFVLP